MKKFLFQLCGSFYLVSCFFICFASGVNASEIIWHLDQTIIDADTVWRNGEIHIVAGENSVLSVAYGATLTIEPGVIIKFDKGAMLEVAGKLYAEGSSSQPIVFTSSKNDQYGGDTNEDDSATTPQPGDWAMIGVPALMNPNQLIDGEIFLKYVIISYGGKQFDNEAFVLFVGKSSDFKVSYSELFNNVGPVAITSQTNNFSLTESNIYAPDYCQEFGPDTNLCGGSFFNWSSNNFDVRNNYWGSSFGPTVMSENGMVLGGVALSGVFNYAPFDIEKKEIFQLEEKKLNPVVLVPGLMGSWKNHQGEWEIDPILHTYDNLLKALRQSGYIDGESLFVFPYEWRQSNVLTAELLKTKINNIKSSCSNDLLDCSKVDVIAHSMGGLVARAYVQGSGYQNDIDQLFFLGTPHEGAPKAFLMWEGGEVGDKFADKVMKNIFKFEAMENGFWGENGLKNYLHERNIASIRELLPIYNYLHNENYKPENLRYYPNNYPRNYFLENLNEPASLNKLSNLKLFNFIGDTDFNTLTSIYLTTSSKEGLWPHGMPVNFYGFGEKGLFYGLGDGTVPIISNNNFYNTQNLVIKKDHGQIVTYAQKEIIKELTGKEPQDFINDWQIPNLLLIAMHSPADIEVIDPQGRKIGKNFSDNSVWQEIPGAFYSGFDQIGQAEFLVIPNPVVGEYKINVVGNGAGGYYDVSADYFGDNHYSSSSFSGYILPQQERKFSVDLKSLEAPIEEITTDISIVSAINDINELYQRGLLKSFSHKQLLLTQYNLLKTKLAVIDRLLKLAVNSRQKIVDNNKINITIKNRLLSLADKELNNLKNKRLDIISESFGDFNKILLKLLNSGFLDQLGYDIIKANNNYLSINL